MDFVEKTEMVERLRRQLIEIKQLENFKEMVMKMGLEPFVLLINDEISPIEIITIMEKLR